jgi:EAL domain-containing protein (putative c-di-GMP-specific phosphodiesterase class I)/GGDEF domain-containing protein
MSRMATNDIQHDDRPIQAPRFGAPGTTRAILLLPSNAMLPGNWNVPWAAEGWSVTTCESPEQLTEALASASTKALIASPLPDAGDPTSASTFAQGLQIVVNALGTTHEAAPVGPAVSGGMLRRGDFLTHLSTVTSAPAHGYSVLMAIRIDTVSELSSQLEMTAIFELEERISARFAALLDVRDVSTIWLELGFGLLIRRENAEQVRQLAERLCACISNEPFLVAGKPRQLTASVGVALSPRGNTADRADRWFATAHAAQAIAYRHGGNRHEGVLSREYEPIPAERVLIIREWVQEAKSGNNVMVEFQPVLPLNGAVAGLYSVHAKLRDYRAPLGGVYRREYLRMAREAGAMIMIDRMSLFGAFEALEQEHARGSQTRLLVQVELATLDGVPLRWLEAELHRRPHLADGLILELEANQKLEQPDSIERIRKLRTLGVRVGLSDHALKLDRVAAWSKLPIDVLRIQFPAVNAVSPEAFRENLAPWRDQGRQLIVDGVEKLGEVTRLSGLGVDYLRGHALATVGPRLDFDFSGAV